MTDTALTSRGPVQTERPVNIDGEPSLVMDWQAPEQMAELGCVPLSPYSLARVTLEKRANRVRVRIATEARDDAPADARPFSPPRPLIVRADRIPLMIARLQAAYDAAIRAGMTHKGGIAS